MKLFIDTDAIQIISAESIDSVSHIITRNIKDFKDFKDSSVEVLTPSSFIEAYQSK
jgi:hypothetical protein